MYPKIASTYGEDGKFDDYIRWKKYYEKTGNGYKRAAKELNIKESTLRWWTQGAKPNSLKMIEELEKLNLLPLTSEDSRLEKWQSFWELSLVMGTSTGILIH